MELQHLFLTTFFMPIGVRQSGYEGKVCVLFFVLHQTFQLLPHLDHCPGVEFAVFEK